MQTQNCPGESPTPPTPTAVNTSREWSHCLLVWPVPFQLTSLPMTQFPLLFPPTKSGLAERREKLTSIGTSGGDVTLLLSGQ